MCLRTQIGNNILLLPVVIAEYYYQFKVTNLILPNFGATAEVCAATCGQTAVPET